MRVIILVSLMLFLAFNIVLAYGADGSLSQKIVIPLQMEVALFLVASLSLILVYLYIKSKKGWFS